MQLNIYDVITSPIITEKALKNQETYNQFSFKVHRNANKEMVRQAIEKIYNVDVEKIQIINVRGKLKRVRLETGRTAAWKKAVVRLKAGQKIEIV